MNEAAPSDKKENSNGQEYLARKYLDIAGVMIVAIDTNQKVKLVNKKGCEVLGYSEAEILGKNWFDNFIPEEAREKVKTIFTKLVNDDIEPMEYVENAVLTKSGGERLIAWHNTVLKDEQGKIIATLSSGEDITERKNTEKKAEALNRELIKANKKLKNLVLQDPLTGLYNHHYLEEILVAELSRARRYAISLSLVMIDIDYFKSVNDSYGHRFGDLILKQFAAQLKRMVRKYDSVIRFGGEEFVVVSPGTDIFSTLSMSQRILDAINLYNFGNNRQTVKLKLSIAAVSYPENRVLGAMDLVELAERIMDKVKQSGGNRVYTLADLTDARHTTRGIRLATDVETLRNKINKLTKRSNETLKEAIFALARTIESKDHTTGEHVERTVRYATEIAQGLGLSSEEIERIKQGCILHDLGKVGVNENILSKKGRLTRTEFAEIKKHPQTGANILRPIKFMHDVIPLILYHHERWDGKGYPVGLKGEDIPIGARIISVADVYQALTANRPYRKALPKKKAIEIIKKGSGTQFDPVVVNQFLEIIQKRKN